MSHSHLSRREYAQQFNAIIDQALLEPSADHQQHLIQLVADINVTQLGERLRQRATRLGKTRRSERARLLSVRDELMQAVYAAAVPVGWSCAWVDGSSIKTDTQRHAGIGGVLMDANGKVIERMSQAIGEQGAFDAEVAALVAMLQLAIDHQQSQLWVYCDNQGLVNLWHEQRDDHRLDKIRTQVKPLQQFALRYIPSAHNQIAHVLAQKAIV